MLIRKANKGDYLEAIEIAKNLKEWFTKEAISNMKTDFLHNNLIVAVEGKKIIGFLCYSANSGKMQIIWMGVQRDLQGKGIGEKLLKELEKEARNYNLHSIEVETLPEEKNYGPYNSTRNFYYKNGFKRIAYKKARIKGWDDQIVMKKKLI
jgi:ribosomal protein S18 acetylase RimI-like enzyme